MVLERPITPQPIGIEHRLLGRPAGVLRDDRPTLALDRPGQLWVGQRVQPGLRGGSARGDPS